VARSCARRSLERRVLLVDKEPPIPFRKKETRKVIRAFGRGSVFRLPIVYGPAHGHSGPKSETTKVGKGFREIPVSSVRHNRALFA